MGFKILVVENEIVIADELCLILSRHGYQVLEPALSYSEAIAAFEQEQPQLAILDLRLGSTKTGLDVARYIKHRSQIPLIFFTACGDRWSLAEMAELNPLACLQKVFTKRDLLERVGEAARSANARSGTTSQAKTHEKKAIGQTQFRP